MVPYVSHGVAVLDVSVEKTGSKLASNVLLYGGRSVSKLQWCLHLIRVCAIFIWVLSFHLGMVFSFGYSLFIWVYSLFILGIALFRHSFIWVWPFLLGIVFSFGYSLFIWV